MGYWDKLPECLHGVYLVYGFAKFKNTLEQSFKHDEIEGLTGLANGESLVRRKQKNTKAY